jgi:tetratricopeptide (TPR) repeat protein
MTRVAQRLSAFGTAATIVAFLAGCATTPKIMFHVECEDPDVRLAAWVQRLEVARAGGCHDEDSSISCSKAVQEIQRLALTCPTHANTTLANAVLAYDGGNSARAAQLLDQLFERSQSLPAAAVLRSQIAIEDGNLALARRVLLQQTQLAPDHPALHEAFAATLYLGGDLEGARRELEMALRLGAMDWRVAYHLGLIDEAENRLDDARQHYRAALNANPSWQPARSRLRALDGGAADRR